MAYWRLHYHLIWATHQRLPYLTESLERQVHGSIAGKANELGVIVHAIGNIPDHIHIVVSIPPKISVAECVRHFKGASSHFVNHQPDAKGDFSWQEGYGALTFGDRAIEDVIAYVRNQKEHHGQNTARAQFERMTEEDDGVHVLSGNELYAQN